MPAAQLSVTEQTKRLIADDKDRIRLDDYVTGLLRNAHQTLSSEVGTPAAVAPTSETFPEHLHRYEDATRDLVHAVILIGRWGNPDHCLLLERIVSHLATLTRKASGLPPSQVLGWYPLSEIFYAAGIAGLWACNYWVFKPLFLTPVTSETNSSTRTPSLVPGIRAE